MDATRIMTGEVDYLEPHGDGKSFYNIGSIRPGETVKVNLGYFVDEDKLDSIFWMLSITEGMEVLKI